MGNTSSSSRIEGRHASPRKGKAALQVLTLGCTSASSRVDDHASRGMPTTIDTIIDAPEKQDSPPPLYVSTSRLLEDDKASALRSFLREYPEYPLTSKLDDLRRREFTRLDNTNETYVDYMGGSLYPDALIRSHMTFLQHNILGNTHSINNP